MMTQQDTTRHRYSVWVGGGEVNDYLLTYQQAHDLADAYRADGYDEVCVDDYDEVRVEEMIS